MTTRIAICGPSGSGKTTLAKGIAAELGIPFVSTSGKSLWDKYGIKSHQDLIQKTFIDLDWGFRYQYELLELRRNELKGYNEYVTDRSPVDNFIYTLLQLSHVLTKEALDNYLEQCVMLLNSQVDVLIYSTFMDVFTDTIENDGYRVTNPYYQMLVDNTFNRVLTSQENIMSICKDCLIISGMLASSISHLRLQYVLTQLKLKGYGIIKE